MEIKLNYTPEELSTLLDGLNNAYTSLTRDYNALNSGCSDGVPDRLRDFFEKKSYKEIEQLMKCRLGAISDLYQYLLTYE